MFDGKDWYLKGEKMKEWSLCTGTDWVLNIAKPIPQTKEEGTEDGTGVPEWKNGDKCIYEGNLYDYQCVASWDKKACILSGASIGSKPFTDAWIDEISKPETEAERIAREELEAAEAMGMPDIEAWFWELDSVDKKDEYRLNTKHKLAKLIYEFKLSLVKAGYTKEDGND